MKHIKKYILFFALIFVSVFSFVFSNSYRVLAEVMSFDYDQNTISGDYPLSSDNIQFDHGAALRFDNCRSLDPAHELYDLKFNFILNSDILTNNLPDNSRERDWGFLNFTYYPTYEVYYQFSLWRVSHADSGNLGTTYSRLYDYLIYYNSIDIDGRYFIASRVRERGNNTFGSYDISINLRENNFSQPLSGIPNYQSLTDNMNWHKDRGYTIEEWGLGLRHLPFSIENGIYNIPILVQGVSSDTEYAVSVSCQYNRYNHDGQFDNLISEFVLSDSRSPLSIVKKMYEANDLYDYLGLNVDPTDPSYDSCEQIKLAYSDWLYGWANFNVKVSYLEEIEGTPFAHKVESSFVCSLPTSGDRNTLVSKDYLLSKCPDRIDTNVIGAELVKFDYQEETSGVLHYDAHYGDHIWLYNKTASGNGANIFCNINQSYEEFFYPLCFGTDTKASVFSSGLYEYVFTQICRKYGNLNRELFKWTSLADNTASNLYGAWAFVSIPEEYNTDQIFSDVFGKADTYNGSLVEFHFDDRLTLSQYNTLVNDYQYNFFEKIWNGAVGLLSGGCKATHYVFIADPAHEGFFGISNTGVVDQTDDGAITSTVKNTLNKVKDIFTGDNKLTSVLKIVAVVLMIVLLIVFVCWVVGLIRKIFVRNKYDIQRYKDEYERNKKR